LRFAPSDCAASSAHAHRAHGLHRGNRINGNSAAMTIVLNAHDPEQIMKAATARAWDRARRFDGQISARHATAVHAHQQSHRDTDHDANGEGDASA
jgi:hypothetical protein